MSDSKSVSPNEAQRPKRGARIIIGVLLAAIGALVLVTLWLAYVAMTKPLQSEPTVQIVRQTPDVIVAVRGLGRLTTVEYRVERVIDLKERQSRLFGLVEGEDAILLVASGDVLAGVDLTKIQDGDIVVETNGEQRRATLHLPAVEIFEASLDNERTYVHTRSTDTLARRNEQLETRARQEAERTIGEAAREGGIEEQARANAETTLRTLLRSLDFDEVVIEFASAEGR